MECIINELCNLKGLLQCVITEGKEGGHENTIRYVQNRERTRKQRELAGQRGGTWVRAEISLSVREKHTHARTQFSCAFLSVDNCSHPPGCCHQLWSVWEKWRTLTYACCTPVTLVFCPDLVSSLVQPKSFFPITQRSRDKSARSNAPYFLPFSNGLYPPIISSSFLTSFPPPLSGPSFLFLLLDLEQFMSKPEHVLKVKFQFPGL